MKPGSAAKPFFGVVPALVDNLGNLIEGAAEGNLVILDSWPGQARTLFGDHDRFVDTYFKTFKGMYFTGDGAPRRGRLLLDHRASRRRAQRLRPPHGHRRGGKRDGRPPEGRRGGGGRHAARHQGQGIYVYVTLNSGVEPSEALRQELKQWVRREIGPIATPDVIQWAPGLPKTRSGKIMRRILRKIAAAEYDTLGDISTLADPGVVQHLIETHRSMQAA